MKLFFSYLKEHIKMLIFAFICIAVFGVIFSLYEIYVEAVIYALIICLIVFFAFLASDFYVYYKKHKRLAELKEEITISLEKLPRADSVLERDYQTLLKALFDDNVQIVSNMDRRSSDMIDYYTMWVHQIKTPIAAMHLLIQDGKSEYEQELKQELFKIEQYVQMVLQYLRLESDYTDFVIRKLELDSIIKQSVKKFASQFIRKKLSLVYEETGETVLSDEKWLSFVIEQMLSNALKYTGKGKISIYMEKDKTLVIEDTGIGISIEDLPRVFEKGFTGYNGRTDKKSTGIGLYLCKRICEKLGHRIWIESVSGKGTKVKIRLKSADIEIE